MADVTVAERKQGHSVSFTEKGWEADVVYLVTGVTAAQDAIQADGVPNYGDAYPGLDLVVTSLKADEFDDDDTRWNVTVHYERPPAADQNRANSSPASFSFDTGEATKHVIQAFMYADEEEEAAKSFGRDGRVPPLSRGLIGWDGEKAQGVDVSVGAFAFSVVQRFSAAEVNDDYLLALSRNGWKTNEAAFGPWEAGEVLYKGASGRYTPGGDPYDVDDDGAQLSGYEYIEGVTRDNSDNGTLYVALNKASDMERYYVDFFSDADQTILVATCQNAVIGGSDNYITEINGSGITGTVWFDRYLFDTDSIKVVFPFPWEITFNFLVSENKSELEVGKVVVINKLGWEYADVRYAPEEQDVGGDTHVVPTAKYVYLQRVYESFDFTLLQIPDDYFSDMLG